MSGTENQGGARRGRVLRRSRGGCRNCKLRKVKCDQAKPQCSGCLKFGVVCNYGINVPDLLPQKEAQSHLAETRRNQMSRARVAIPPLKERISTKLITKSTTVSIEVDARSIRMINQLHNRMHYSYRYPAGGIFQLAHHYPSLMHATLALAFAYDRYLHQGSLVTKGRPLMEMYHFCQCTTMFKEQLHQNLSSNEKDAVWGTASFLSILLFLAIDESDSTKAWPFKSSECPDLDWLRMGDNKWRLFELTNPLRPESIFNPVATVLKKIHDYKPVTGIDEILPDLLNICSLDASSSSLTSPYFEAAQAVSRVYKYADSHVPLSEGMAYVVHMELPFRALLAAKDPVALLLTAIWYRKSRKAVWWIGLRSAVECEAICMYLRQYHSDKADIMDLLSRDILYDSSDEHKQRHAAPTLYD